MIQQKRNQLLQKTIQNPAITGKCKKPDLAKDVPAHRQGVGLDDHSKFPFNLHPLDPTKISVNHYLQENKKKNSPSVSQILKYNLIKYAAAKSKDRKDLQHHITPF